MKSVLDFQKAREHGRPISMVTSYDSWSAALIEKSPIDCILVGDSAAMVMHGEPNTLAATVDMMVTHTRAVRKGAPKTFVIADLPFLSHRKGIPAAMDAVQALCQAGAQAVKLEGADGHLDVIRHIVESGVPVMGHLGLTPQSVHALGGHRIQGRDSETAQKLVHQAKALEAAGCFALVLECIPESLARQITNSVTIATIGIGSGPGTSGQVLVFQDLLGLNSGFHPVFVRKYLEGEKLIQGALAGFAEDVSEGAFPTLAESYLS